MIAEASSTGAKRAHGASQGTSAMLSADRWSQLDWDDDGSVTLREFISAFYSWVGLDDGDDETEYETTGVEAHDHLNAAGQQIALEDQAPTPARVPPPSEEALAREQKKSSKPRGGAFRKKSGGQADGAAGSAAAGSDRSHSGTVGATRGRDGGNGGADVADENGRRVSFDGRKGTAGTGR